MSDQQYQRQRQQEQQKSRQNEGQHDSQTQGRTAVEDAPYSATTLTPAAQKQLPTLNMGELKRTDGRAGARNISLEWFWVRVGNSFPCGFKVKTLPENELEVTLEQVSYRRVHNGKGDLTTQVVPVVPIGTKGKLVARDLATGEVVEQPWTWRRFGPLSRLWDLVKKLLFKSS